MTESKTLTFLLWWPREDWSNDKGKDKYSKIDPNIVLCKELNDRVPPKPMVKRQPYVMQVEPLGGD